MRNFFIILCLCIGVSCASIGQRQNGVVQPNKIEHKNPYVSRIIPKAETAKKEALKNEPKIAIKLENGGVVPVQQKVTSMNIPVPATNNVTKKEVKEQTGIIYVTEEELEKLQEPEKESREQFWDKVFRYSLFWFAFIGFIAIAYRSFKKSKIPSFNPFKKKEQKEKPPEQLNLNL